MRCRPRSGTVFSFHTFEARCLIGACPQQKWDYKINDNTVTVSHKDIDMEISKKEFNNKFKIID
jgi:hypothetical protein